MTNLDNYTIREASKEAFKEVIDQYGSDVFADTHVYHPRILLSDAEKEQKEQLEQNLSQLYELYLLAYDANGDPVGWTWGRQETRDKFYMINSAILEPHRGRGLYKALLNQLLEMVTARGFQLIYSRHNMTNNAIIIPKLKAGFIIAKMELDDQHGTLIHLHYYPNPTRRKVMDYRCGQQAPNEEIEELFKADSKKIVKQR